MNKKIIKRIISGAVALTLLAFLVLAVIDDGTIEKESFTPVDYPSVEIRGEQLVAENNYLQLYVRGEDARIRVVDKNTGKSWYTNPPAGEEDESLQGLFRQRVSSQLSVVYFETNRQRREMNSYGDAVEEEQFGFREIDNGIRVEYRLGSAGRGIESIPQKVSIERFEELILDNLEDPADIREINRRFVLRQDEGYYELRDIPTHTIPNILELLDKVGYTQEDLEQDNLEFGIEVDIVERAFLEIPLEYILEGPDLKVRVPGREISYSNEHSIASIRLLEFFGSAQNGDPGYFLVPDGSGALLRFDTQRTDASTIYSSSVFGRDISVPLRQQTANLQPVRLPVFGVNEGENGFLAVIEEGSAIGRITAANISAYHGVFPSFQIKTQDLFRIGEGQNEVSLPSFQKQAYSDDIVVRYMFLENGNSDFISMAERYRNYLTETGQLPESQTGNKSGVIETLGVYNLDKSFLGIPYTGKATMTTFEQAKFLADDMFDLGMDNIALRFSGWANGGIDHSVFYNASAERSLGGRRGLRDLIAYSENLTVFPDVGISSVYDSSLRFIPRFHGARNLSSRTILDHGFDRVTRMADMSRPAHMISPERIGNIAKSFTESMEKADIQGVSIRDLPDLVHSSLTGDNLYNREETSRILAESIGVIRENADSLMVSGGNVYSLAYADLIVNAPLTSSRLNSLAEPVPFFQAVVHGRIQYAGTPLNLSEDYNTAVLDSMRTGALPYFYLTYENSSDLKDTRYNFLFSTYHMDWKERIEHLYDNAGDFISEVAGSSITGYQQLEKGVFETTFENGARVIVNYSSSDYISQDYTVSPMGYITFSGRGNR